MTGRPTPEWIGRTPESRPPPRVALRVFEREKGVCHISKRKITAADAWELDHITALCNGGENRESNLAPALIDKHREKTKTDVAEKSDIYKKRRKHVGIKVTKKAWPKRSMSPAFKSNTRDINADLIEEGNDDD